MEDKLLYKDLTYRIRGIMFEIQNELGRFRNEKQYGDALASKFDQNAIKYKREFILPISFDGEKIGRNRVDFLVEDLVIIELKCEPVLTRDDYHQCQRYLESTDLDLALLVNFRPRYLLVRRILNHKKFNNKKDNL